MPEVEFEANGGTRDGLPGGAGWRGPGIVVLQEWWGVDEHIRDVCDRFAGEGFLALAPDLYHGETTDQPDEAQQKMMAMNMDEAEKEMRGAVEYLLDAREVQRRGRLGRLLPRRRALGLGRLGQPARSARRRHLLLRDAARQADFSRVDGPGPRPLRDQRRLRLGRGREGARAGAPGGRRRGRVRVLRGRRRTRSSTTRPARHLRPRARARPPGSGRSTSSSSTWPQRRLPRPA